MQAKNRLKQRSKNANNETDLDHDEFNSRNGTPSRNSTPSPSPSTSSLQNHQNQNNRHQRQPQPQHRLNFDESDSNMETSAIGDSDSGTYLNEIELIFRTHPNDQYLLQKLKENSIRYLKTTWNATVEHLCKYLATRLSIDLNNSQLSDSKNYSILISTQKDQFTPLAATLTLSQVNDQFWKLNKPLELYYSRKNS